MTQFFDFKQLIKKYSTEFTAFISSTGSYDDNGDYISGESTEMTLQGAIISHRQNKIFRSEGTITEQDRALYMLYPLENALVGAKIVYGGNVYRIGALLENSTFTGVWYYNLKYVSAFNEVGDEND